MNYCKYTIVGSFLFLIFLVGCEQKSIPNVEVPSSSTDRQFYQLKTYLLDSEEQVKATDTYLQNAYLPTMKRLGISPIGVFKERPSDEVTGHKILLLLPFNSLNQVQEIEDALVADSEHQKLGAAYINAAHDAPTFNRMESVLMRAFVDMPQLKPSPLSGPRSERIYELRSYESATEAIYRNKVDMFNAGGEVTLFDKIGSNAVFYGEVISGANMPNLMYMTTYENQESREAHWKTFVDSPEWNKLKVRPEYQNNVSLNEKTFLYPASYSDY